MRDIYKKKQFIAVCLSLFICSGIMAQPQPGQLADRIIERNNQILSGIESIEITVETEEGGFFPPATTRYVKRTENGSSWLEPEGMDPDTDTGLLSGVFDDQVPILISGASSITNDEFDGFSVYKVIVDDEGLLNELVDDELEFSESEIHVKQATIWIDTEDLVARKIYFEQTDENGGELNVEILLNDYRVHEGLPIAHSIQFNIEGLEAHIMDEDIAEARQALEEMREQLSLMPEAQRKAIEEQLAPQIEQFEAMVDNGEMGGMTLKITEVRVNP